MSKAWGKVRTTLQADNALRTGHRERGLQDKRKDNPPPADNRPAPVNPPDNGGYAPPPGQNWAPQHGLYPYTGQAAYPPSQGHDHDHYNMQQPHVSRHNTFPSSQGDSLSQNMGRPSAYQEPDRRPQYPPHQDHSSSHYQNPDPYIPTSSSGSNQGYSGQPHQEPYSNTNMSPEAYHHGQSDYYGSTPRGQDHSYPQYSQSSSSDPPPPGPPGRATTVPANFPHPHGAPPTSGYYGGGYYGGNDRGGRYY